MRELSTESFGHYIFYLWGEVPIKNLHQESRVFSSDILQFSPFIVLTEVAYSLSIHYSNPGFLLEYIVANEKLQRIINGRRLTEKGRKNISGLLHKLRRITTRNLITHEILEGILNYQREYFESNSELDLKPLRSALVT